MRKINEIFLSIQGEGYHTGVPSIFIRFSGCNLKCGFCDTVHQDGMWMEDADILKEVLRYKASLIVLTGGEPSLQIDEGFIRSLKEVSGLRIAIETNGTKELPAGIDWITVSPKIGADGCDDNNTVIKVTHANELKVIDTGQDLESYFTLNCVDKNTVFVLQPCDVPCPEQREANIKRTIRRVLADPRWRLSLQTHKFLGIK